MKTTSKLLSLAVAAMIMASCQKEPTASFKTDKTEYVAGETVKLTNTSIDGSSYKWTMPDGQTSDTKDVDYTLNVNDADASITFKLEAFSKNGKKKDETSVTVTEKAATGQATFYQTGIPTSYNQTTVTINGESRQITLDFPSGTPGCSETGCAIFTLKVGTHNFTATEQSPGTATWSGTVTITKNACQPMKLS